MTIAVGGLTPSAVRPRATGLGVAIAVASCGPGDWPPECRTRLPSPREDGFARAVLDGGAPFAAWQRGARSLLEAWYRSPGAAGSAGGGNTASGGAAPVVSGRGFRLVPSPSSCPSSDAELTRWEAAEGPEAGMVELARGGERGLVILVHGHGSTAPSAFTDQSDLFGLGCTLVAAGWWVAVPELGGFGRRGQPPHGARIASRLVPGRFMREEVAMLSDVVDFVRGRVPNGEASFPTFVVGHSLGGHLALQLAALRSDAIHGAFLSGLFLPLECINSPVHHACQHQLGLFERLESEDLAMLVAPRPLTIAWGALDVLYTESAVRLADRTRDGFEAIDAAAAFDLAVTSDQAHRLNGSEVFRFLDRATR